MDSYALFDFTFQIVFLFLENGYIVPIKRMLVIVHMNFHCRRIWAFLFVFFDPCFQVSARLPNVRLASRNILCVKMFVWLKTTKHLSK